VALANLAFIYNISSDFECVYNLSANDLE